MDKRRIAIDPGDTHVGYAYNGFGSAVTTGEWTPAECCDELIDMFTKNEVDEVVLEEFVLYQQEYANQAWSPMKTSQLIGAIKLICRWFRIPWVEQGAYIKKPTRAQLRGRGIRQVGKDVHEKDAELHLYHRILRDRAEE